MEAGTLVLAPDDDSEKHRVIQTLGWLLDSHVEKPRASLESEAASDVLSLE